MNVKMEKVCRAHQKRCSNCGKQPRVGRIRIMARFGRGQNWCHEELCFCGEKCYTEYWEYLLTGASARLKEMEGD